jgi:hypothetical protein
VTGYPFSISLWFKIISTDPIGHLFTLTSPTLTNGVQGGRFSILLNAVEITFETQGSVPDNSTTVATIDLTSQPLSAWRNVTIIAQSSASTDIRLYYNGNQLSASNNTDGKTPTNISQVIIGARRNAAGTLTNFANNASVAEVGVWSTAISIQDMISLSQGFSPLKIRPDQLRYYAPLIRDRVELAGGLALVPSTNPPTTEEHPRKIDN